MQFETETIIGLGSAALALLSAGAVGRRWRTGRPGWRTPSTGRRRKRTPTSRRSGSSSSTATRSCDAAHTLQGRLFNIVAQGFLGKAYGERRRRVRAPLCPRLHRVRDRRVPVLGRDPAPRAALPRPGRRQAQPGAARAPHGDPVRLPARRHPGAVPRVPGSAAGHRRGDDGADQRRRGAAQRVHRLRRVLPPAGRPTTTSGRGSCRWPRTSTVVARGHRVREPSAGPAATASSST